MTHSIRLFLISRRPLLRRVLFLVGAIAAAPMVLLIVAMRPFVLLRFGTMWSERIGPFTGDVEVYLCLCDRDKPGRLNIDIIGCPEPACNRQIRKMWARNMTITPGAKLWSFMDWACQFWTKGDKHHINLSGPSIPEYRILLSTQPKLSFTKEEELRGLRLLEKLAIPADAHWICIHNRDAAYLDNTIGGRCWDYHDYRDFSVRSLVSAAEELTKRGYYVLRMGSIVAEPLVSNNPKIIDYALNPLRNDFADIYLMAKSVAYFGSDSGIFTIALIFRKPIFYINFTPSLLEILTHYCPWPFIMKQLWHKEQQRFLSLREIFEIGLAGACTSDAFEEAGVELVCNAPEEIRELAVEVDERLQGHWQPQPADEELQLRFWSIFQQYAPPDCRGDVPMRIGTAFLRKHMYLLD